MKLYQPSIIVFYTILLPPWAAAMWVRSADPGRHGARSRAQPRGQSDVLCRRFCRYLYKYVWFRWSIAEKTHRLGYQRGLTTWKQNGSSWISTVHYLYFQVRITIDLGKLNYIWIYAMNTKRGLLIPTDFGTGLTTRPESWCRNFSKSNDVKLNLPLANILCFQHVKTLW